MGLNRVKRLFCSKTCGNPVLTVVREGSNLAIGIRSDTPLYNGFATATVFKGYKPLERLIFAFSDVRVGRAC